MDRRVAGRARALRAWLLAGVGAAIWVTSAAAETSASGGSGPAGTTIDAVVVTAQKRTERLQTVPQSISVLNDQLLTRTSSDSLETFANFVPGLEMQAFAPGRTRITIRGISPDEQTGVSTVSYYLDEIPLTAADQRSQPEVWLYDVDRVEVLRGPQGTLYGEGAMGGTVRIVTNKPNTAAFGASMKVNGYSVDHGGLGYSVDGMVNLPIVKDVLALRVVAENRENAGWIDDRIVSIPDPSVAPPARYATAYVDKNSNRSYDTSGRVSLLFTPTKALQIDATYVGNWLNVHNANIGDINIYQNEDLGLRPSKDHSDLANLLVSYAFDSFTVTSSSSYTARYTDQTAPQEPILLGSTLPSTYVVQEPSSTRTFTQEVRAVSTAAQPFRWTVGAYYRTGREADTAIGNAYVPLLGATINVTDYRLVSDYSSYAVFGQAEYDILSNLTLIGGLRWFEESGTGAASFGGSPYNSLKRSTTGVTPRVGLRYTVNKDLMAYVTYSEGYRPGGFNQFAGPTQYQPDKTKNYEIGAKYASPDGRFIVDGSIYYIDWSNMQFTQLSSGGLFTYVGNANKASSRGAELQASYRWSNGFSLALSGSVTDAHLDSDVHGNYSAVIRSGTTLPAVPPYKVSAVANYQRAIFGDYILDLTADISLVGHQNTKLEEGGVYHDPIFGGNYTIGTKLKAYQTGNLRAELRHDKWSVAVYLKNVWNETAPIADDNFLPTFGQPLYYLQPRTVGVELSAKF